MEILTTLIAALLISLTGHHWNDIKKLYKRFRAIDDQALLTSVHILVVLIGIAGLLWTLAY